MEFEQEERRAQWTPVRPEAIEPLTLELLAWVASGHRSYKESMEAWRSMCPRHSVWEDAFADGLLAIERGKSIEDAVVVLTARGRASLPAKDPTGVEDR